MNAAYAFYLDELRALSGLDPEAYADAVERFDAWLEEPFNQPRRLQPVSDADAERAAKLEERRQHVLAMGGDVG